MFGDSVLGSQKDASGSCLPVHSPRVLLRGDLQPLPFSRTLELALNVHLMNRIFHAITLWGKITYIVFSLHPLTLYSTFETAKVTC